MIQCRIDTNGDAILRSLSREFPNEVLTGVNMGLARASQKTVELLRSDEFIGGISAQIVKSRQSVGRGVYPPDRPSPNQGQRYDSAWGIQLVRNFLHYTVGTPFKWAAVHEIGTVIHGRPFLVFRVPSAISFATGKGSKWRKLKTPKVTGWKLVFARKVTIPRRPAWHNVFDRVNPQVIGFVMEAIRERLKSKGLT
jgi:hypothetical protein